MKKILGVVLLLSVFLILAIVSVQAAVTNCTNSTGENVTTGNGAYYWYWDDGTGLMNVTAGNVCINLTSYDVKPTSTYFCGNVSVMIDQACTYPFYYTGFIGNGSSTCSNLNATDGGPYTLGVDSVINTTINASWATRSNYIQVSGVTTPAKNACANAYTLMGPSGYCDGGGSLDTNDSLSVIPAGRICVGAGVNVTANATVNCGTWNECVASATSYSSYYVGYDGIGSGCGSTNWTATGVTTTLASGVSISSSVNQTAACSTFNSGLTNGCNNLKTLIFSAFGLLAVGIIIAAAFALINFGDTNALSIVAVSSIALAIVLFVGFVVMSSVAASVCIIIPV